MLGVQSKEKVNKQTEINVHKNCVFSSAPNNIIYNALSFNKTIRTRLNNTSIRRNCCP